MFNVGQKTAIPSYENLWSFKIKVKPRTVSAAHKKVIDWYSKYWTAILVGHLSWQPNFNGSLSHSRIMSFSKPLVILKVWLKHVGGKGRKGNAGHDLFWQVTPKGKKSS